MHIGVGVWFDGDFIGWIIFGALAGWIASSLYRGRGFGCLGNTLLGIIGAVIGGFLLSLLHIQGFGGFLGSLVTAVLGALVLIFLADLFGRDKSGRGRRRPY